MTNIIVSTPRPSPTIFINRRAYRRLNEKKSCTHITPANLLFEVDSSGDLRSAIDLGCKTKIVVPMSTATPKYGFVYYAELRPFCALSRSDIHAAGFKTKQQFMRDWNNQNAEQHKSTYNPVVAVLHISAWNAVKPNRKPWVIPLDEYPGVWMLPVNDWFPAFLDDDEIIDMHGILAEASCAKQQHGEQQPPFDM